ncbi:MAG TPA: alkaline phosphatase, partial [Actinomycetota bacterium]|nr:alkaline phosphatase [Actinomycetota bacterium]
ERFGLQNTTGGADPNGVRQFTVGTGGKSLYPFGTIRANSEAQNNTTYGVLMLKLQPSSYSWRFIPEAGKTYTDSGSTACH